MAAPGEGRIAINCIGEGRPLQRVTSGQRCLSDQVVTVGWSHDARLHLVLHVSPSIWRPAYTPSQAMKLLLLCLALPFAIAVVVAIMILIVHHLGMLDTLVRAGLNGLCGLLSGRPP